MATLRQWRRRQRRSLDCHRPRRRRRHVVGQLAQLVSTTVASVVPRSPASLSSTVNERWHPRNILRRQYHNRRRRWASREDVVECGGGSNNNSRPRLDNVASVAAMRQLVSGVRALTLTHSLTRCGVGGGLQKL